MLSVGLLASLSLGCGLDISRPAPTPNGATSEAETTAQTSPTLTVAVTQVPTIPTPTATVLPTATATVTPTPTPAVKLAARQVFRLPGVSPSTLDPHLSNDDNSAEYVVEIFSGLMAFDPALNLTPDLAESYQVSSNGRVYTFKLRPNAKFQDGRPVQAQDFKWSFERACDPATGSPTADTYLGDIVGCRAKLQGQASDVAGVAALNDLTLQLTIDAPKGFFLAKMSYPTAYVLDRENVESGGPTWFTRPNGSGPFKLDEYNPGQQVIMLRRNENYYREPQPTLTEVKYFVNAPLDMLTGYQQSLSALGEPAGVTYEAVKLPNDRMAEVAGPDNPLGQQLVAVNLLSVDYIGFNVNQPPFNDVKIRQAFNLALDKRAIVKSAFYGLVPVANGIVPSSLPGYQNPDLSDYEFDLEHALDLIAASSYHSVGNLPPIALSVSDTGIVEQAIINSYRENLGINVTLKKVPWLEYLSNLNQPNMPYQLYRLGWLADYPDPQNFLEVLFYSKSSQNYGGYNNPEVDALLDEARGTPDVGERLALYRQVEQLVLDDAAWIPLYFEVENWLVKPYVQNFHIPPIKAPKFQYVAIIEY